MVGGFLQQQGPSGSLSDVPPPSTTKAEVIAAGGGLGCPGLASLGTAASGIELQREMRTKDIKNHKQSIVHEFLSAEIEHRA